MKNLFLAGVLTLPVLFLGTQLAQAQYPGCNMPYPGCNTPSYGHHLPCPNFGCGGFCVNLFGRIHQHGPLFNYGPYYGYYPFQPYGPWTPELCYNPPIREKHHGFGRGEDRQGWGRYALDTLRNVMNRVNPLDHIRSKCHSSGCASAAECSGCGKILTAPASVCSSCAPAQLAPAAAAASTHSADGASGVLTGIRK